MSIEAAGFVERGGGTEFAASGGIGLDGEVPIVGEGIVPVVVY